MQPVARKGDPISHGGTITSGSAHHLADGREVARVGDTALCDRHGPVTITSGSPSWEIGGRRVARVGSTCSCGATVSAGSPKVFART